jgi:hypothetical protein
MINRLSMKIGEQVERPVSVTAPANIQEGAVLCAVIENGGEAVTVLATVSGSEKIAGFSILPYQNLSTATAMEQFTVPSSGSLIFSLRNPSLVSGSEQAAVVGGSPLTIDETSFSATPPTGTVKVDIVGGRLKFAAGNAGAVVNFLYRYNLTVNQIAQRYQSRSINNLNTVQQLNQVGVAKGYVEIATDQFDTTQDYTSGAALKVGANGFVTNAGSGALIPGGRVLAVPSLTDTSEGAFLKISALIA